MLRSVFSYKFIRALWLAGRRGAKESIPATLLQGCRVLLTLLETAFFPGKLASENIAKLRYEACKQCPIYCAELDTCGDARTIDDKPLGCFCALSLKTKLAESRCWLHEDEQFGLGHDAGWPEGTR